MKRDLMFIVDSCFNESKEYTEFLFKHRININNYFVCIEDGKVVSGLYVIPCNIFYKGSHLKSIYIYAAGTLKEYRKRGLMSGLIRYTNEVMREEGNIFSVLCPANEDLIKFYKKLEYRKFFKYTKVSLDNKDMKMYLEYSSSDYNELTLEEFEKLRREIYRAEGSVIWDKESLKYALDANIFLGGATVYCKYGCAVCFVSKKNNLEVIDFTVKEENIRELLGNIYSMFSACDSYNIRIPFGRNILGNKGETKDLGMINPLTKESERIINNIVNSGEEGSYISLVLD